MSVLLGISDLGLGTWDRMWLDSQGSRPARGSGARFDQLDEIVKQVVGIVRSRRRLGMVLDAEHRAAPCDAGPRRCRRTGSCASPRHRSGSDPGSTAKPWFCDVISILPVVELLHRMVGAPVAELQLVGRRRPSPGRESGGRGRCRTPARPTRRAPWRCRRRTSDGRGIARAVAQEHAVRGGSRAAPRRASTPGTRARRTRARSSAAGCSTSCRSRRRRSSAAASARCSGATLNSSGSSSGQSNAWSEVTTRTRSAPSILGIAFARVRRAPSRRGAFARRDHAAHDAAGAQLPRQRPRVDVRDGHDAVRDEVVAQGPGGAPVARHGRLVANDEPRHVRLARLDVVRRHAVVADLGATSS